MTKLITLIICVQLPIMPQSYASYDTVVLGVRAIRTAPSEMESTTHAFAWGTDLYYVLLRPARGFDMLQEDFSFALLIVAVAALVTGVGVMRQIVQRAKLHAAWK